MRTRIWALQKRSPCSQNGLETQFMRGLTLKFTTRTGGKESPGKEKFLENEPPWKKKSTGVMAPNPNHGSIQDGIRHYNIRFCHGALSSRIPGLQATTTCPFARSLFPLPLASFSPFYCGLPNVTNSSICQFVVIRGAVEGLPEDLSPEALCQGFGADWIPNSLEGNSCVKKALTPRNRTDGNTNRGSPCPSFCAPVFKRLL